VDILAIKRTFIEKFTIPEITEQEIAHLRTLNNSQDIDEFLIEKYQLNVFAGNLS
jgi:adenine-specific DNA-methyltransferase